MQEPVGDLPSLTLGFLLFQRVDEFDSGEEPDSEAMVSDGLGRGGGQRTADYRTPIGVVDNSKSRISNGNAGFGWFSNRGFASIDYKANDGRYGIPFASEIHGYHGHEEEGEHEEDEEELEGVDLAFRRHNVRFTGGLRNLGSWVDGFELSLNYSDWNHDEVEVAEDGDQEIGTTFENQQFSYRGVFTQDAASQLRGSFGFQGAVRRYEATGEEALSPPVDHGTFAVFALEEIGFERVQLQLGGRIESNRYEPKAAVLRRGLHHDGEEEGEEEPEPVTLPRRNFTGGSAGIGARFDLWPSGAFVANFTTSFRSPALEERITSGRTSVLWLLKWVTNTSSVSVLMDSISRSGIKRIASAEKPTSSSMISITSCTWRPARRSSVIWSKPISHRMTRGF